MRRVQALQTGVNLFHHDFSVCDRYAGGLEAAAKLQCPASLVLGALLCGYGFAWVGHFGFEKNRPASFKRPLYSFMGDWVMYTDIWTGKIPF